MRSQHERELEDGGGTLWKTPAALPVQTTLEVELPRGKRGFAARTATLAQGDGDPGPEVLWHGFAKLRTLAEEWRVFRKARCG